MEFTLRSQPGGLSLSESPALVGCSVFGSEGPKGECAETQIKGETGMDWKAAMWVVGMIEHSSFLGWTRC